MAKSLFDHLKQVTEVQNPKYWETLDESDKKSWSNYMVLRFLSMNSDWVDLVSALQRYVQELPPRAMYLMLIGIIPKGRVYLRYIKPKSQDKYEKWLIELVSKYYSVPKIQAEEYLEILYQTEQGKLHILDICGAFGTDPKLVKKLKFKFREQLLIDIIKGDERLGLYTK